MKLLKGVAMKTTKILSRGSLFLMIPFFLLPIAATAADTAAVEKTSYLSFGTRLGEETVEGYTDLIYPLFATPSNTFFFNPRFSLKDEGANEANIGLGYRRKLTGWLVGGTNVYFDSRESEHGNRFNQWGAGLEFFSEYVDVRANYYDADNDKERIGDYSQQVTETSTQVSYGNGGQPFATGHEVVSERTRIERTTTKVTGSFFEQFEAGMDGWDAEIGGKLPLPKGPEIRLFAGYYDYDNTLGDDFSGGKGRLEVKTGSWLSLDAEVFEDEDFNDTSYFVGFRLQVPLSSALSWQGLKEGLFSGQHRDLDRRMRSEMVVRDVRVQTEDSDWQEDLSRRQVKSSVSEKKTKERVVLADHITFVDGDTSGPEDGTNENPYSSIQAGVDNAGANNTIFVYETGGTATGKPGAGDGGGFYDEQVVLQEGQTLTSTVSWTSHGGGSYQTTNLPIIRPTTEPGSGWQTYTFGVWNTTAPVVAMAAETTVRRMAVDTIGLTGFGPDWGATSGLYANINDSQNAGLRAEENQITTNQYGSIGIVFDTNVAQGSHIDLRANSIVTSGEIADAIVVDALSSNAVTLNISGGEITTEGPDVWGISLYADNSKAITFNVSDGAITTQRNISRGISIELEDAETATINIANETITGQGDDFSGIRVNALDSTAVNDTIAGNVFNVEGADSWGIYVGNDTANSFDQAGLEADNTFSITDPATSVKVEVTP